ncbi:NAD-dependent epimerase/dehydratase family protein, partial [Nocardiopsis lucentensis]|uniref:NAD-dependent epimerase/dehydratase family protein n=1 Tax=Nocardiopsis lucentensis TaxID=53441 RepID=UPI0003688269
LSLPGRAAEAVGGADAVVHLAASIGGHRSWREADERTERLNVGLVWDLVAALGRTGDAARPPTVVFTSTIQAGDERPPVPGTYAAQKAAAERVLLTAHAEGRINATVLRLCTVFGASPLGGATGRGVVSAMAGRALAGQPLPLWHDGSVERDLLDVRDAA